MKSSARLEKWVEIQLSWGRFGFALDKVREDYPDHSDNALKLALKRLTDKGKVLSIYKGYYLIIPPQYSYRGVLPPALYLDAFMKFLDRPYYVALLNAAAFYGAAHQQPQEYFVVTAFPIMRTTRKKGLVVNYIHIDEIPLELINLVKTEAGYLKVSNPVLTASDIVQYEKRVGGINRAATVLRELSEVMKPEDLTVSFINHVPVTAIQRLGYLLDFVCFNTPLANTLFEKMSQYGKHLYRVPLKASGKKKGISSSNRWKVIVNIEIDTDV